MNFKLFSVLAFVSIVAAQSGVTTPTASGTDSGSMEAPSAVPTGGPGAAVPSCVLNCIVQSGCGPTDTECLCITNLQTITGCVTSNCSPDDQAAAATIQGTLCASASGAMSGAMNSTTVTGSATTQDLNTTSISATESSSSVPSLTVTRTTPSPTLTPRTSSTGTTTTGTSAGASTSTNAAVPQNIVAQGVWVMVASLIGLAVAA